MPAETRRTPTETLLSAMEEFGQCEPKDCLVIYTNEGGDLVWLCSSDQISTKLGLIEACKYFILKKI